MCHNSVLESEQIDKCIENGMPHKIIKTVKYTMRRRAEAAAVTHQPPSSTYRGEKTEVAIGGKRDDVDAARSRSSKSIMKCPFAHGLISIPTTTTTNSTQQQLGRPWTGAVELKNSDLYEGQSIGLLDTNSSNAATGVRNVSGHIEEISPTEDIIIYNDDILAKSTQLTKRLTYHMQQALGRLQTSKLCTLLTKTAQPAHVLAIGILTFVLLTIWPEVIQDTSTFNRNGDNVISSSSPTKNKSTLALIVYLGAFSTHFGSQIWMTFVSGLSLYFSLPRHMFGQCQQILFPKYFAMNGVLSITMLILFVKYFVSSWTMSQCIQLGALSLTGAIEVLVRLYLAPPLLYLMHEKYKIEGTVGSGKEVGSLVQGDLIQCPHYQRIHKAFRRIHMTVAIGNLITMAASCLHLYYIAGQIQISI